MSGAAIPRHLVVVLGATGDLMQRKLLPALLRATPVGENPALPTFVVLGAARAPLSDDDFRSKAAASLTADGAVDSATAAAWANGHLRYQSLGEGTPADYARLAQRIASVEGELGLPGNRIFYLALPYDAVPIALQAIGETGLAKAPGWSRVVIEKPFGHDLASAEALNQLVHRYFAESQVYRIDHYLGKETVQNLLVFRFSNMLFESLWNRAHIDHVEITVAEDLGLEHRAEYYDRSGALRDMVQNHLTQLLTLVAMEVPAAYDADAIRSEKVKVLRSIAPLDARSAVFGQYSAGTSEGGPVPGYSQEVGVAPGSTTETFVAVALAINNWRWQGVPFFLRTGKRLPTKLSEVVIHFRAPPVWFFPPTQSADLRANTLTITVQPDEGFELGFETKKPGHAIDLETTRMHFRYAEAFGPLSDAYQTLLVDVMCGDQTLFVRADEVEESWRVYSPLLTNPPPLRPYPAGAWGPPEADALLAPGGYRWSPT